MANENFKNFLGKCKCCGIEYSVIALTQEDADEIATENCKCNGAQLEKIKVTLKSRLNDVCGTHAPDFGFSAVDPEIYTALRQICDWVVENKIHNATLQIDETKIQIANTGNKCKVKRIKTITQSAEV